MGISRREAPNNLSEIFPHVITDKQEIAEKIIVSSKCYFYDTSSFRKHALIKDAEKIFEYIKVTEGIVVITRSVMLELCTSEGKLWNGHIDYIRRMSEYGIDIVIMYEEDVFDVMYICYSSSEINKALTYAVRTCKSRTGAIEQILKEKSVLSRKILKGEKISDKQLVSDFLKAVRCEKKAKDNMGEELLAICIHMLSNIPELIQYKYVVFTEDKGAVSLVGKTVQNIYNILHMHTIAVMTTPRLLQDMIKLKMIEDVNVIADILKTDNVGKYVRIFCCEKYELLPKSKTMTYEELATKMVNTQDLHIFY